ncbi:hypothetical protein F9288_19060 [Sphingomonas sp. CL5.1]|uniref:hypothetical protein n=1 Tax=Sphingomonas sp. CL5.1 TaxID=2653203 RepID=UPI001581B2E7|nr:hypothetical protein [Sphingomonas sp. CL5.1]QKS01489.1 hypothetical protein F9288_19060 [Sphingomonas sp. CL5.1]
MNGFLKKVGLGAALAATALVSAAPADAQRWGGYRHYGHGYRGGDAGAAALVGGIVGLGIGAAIASNNRPYGYYDRGYYGPPPAYYYERPYYPRCWTSWRWDPYWGRDVPVRVCR